jgi:ABC-2 type transport system ATP-binding protein
MSNAIEVEGLTKEFDGVVAVDHVSFSISQGEVFGFLGPNGAGKTTTIKMLCTILNPSSGSARVCGYDIVKEKDKVRECIGIVFQDPTIDTFLTGRENLDFHARMYRLDKKTREKRITEVLELLDLKGQENKKIGDCSGGTQRRFEVARGFLNRPQVLFLDEPTLGLDVWARRSLWQYIKRINEQEGTTIILTTHYIEEADYLCHRVAIIDQGRIVAMDMPQELKRATGLNLISLQIAQEGTDNVVALLRQLPWVRHLEVKDNTLKLTTDNAEERIAELIDFIDSHKIAVSSIKLHQPTLEDAFLHFTGKAIREEEGSLQELFRAWMIRSRGRR